MLSEFLKHRVAVDRHIEGMLCFDRESRKTVMKNKLRVSCRDNRV